MKAVIEINEMTKKNKLFTKHMQIYIDLIVIIIDTKILLIEKNYFDPPLTGSWVRVSTLEHQTLARPVVSKLFVFVQ